MIVLVTASDITLVIFACKVILGWAYAQDKHVKKYAELLRSLGYSSLRFTCPATDVMSVFERPRIAWAKRLLKELQSDHLAPHR